MNVLNLMLSRKRGGLERAALDAHEGLLHAGCTVKSVLAKNAWVGQHWPPGYDQAALASFASWDPLAQLKLARLTARANADVVLCHGNRAILTARRARRHAPVIPICHTTNYSVLKVLDLIDGAIVLTPHYRDKLIDAGFPSERLRLVPNAIRLGPEPAPPFASAQVTIGALGRIAPNKGFDILIEACRLLVERAVKVRCVIGGVDLEGKTEALAALRAAAGLSPEDVHFPGWISDPAAFLRSLDVFVMPSRREVLSIALLEALEAGRPIVCTRVPGLESVFDHGTEGLFVDLEDPRGLADAIASLVAQPEMARAMAAAARRRAAQFDLPVIGRRLSEALHELAALARLGKGAEA